jgi:hypothetical protein
MAGPFYKLGCVKRPGAFLWRRQPPKDISKEHCFHIEPKFFRATFSTTLRSKIVENAALKNILWRRKPPKDVPEAFYTTPGLVGQPLFV